MKRSIMTKVDRFTLVGQSKSGNALVLAHDDGDDKFYWTAACDSACYFPSFGDAKLAADNLDFIESRARDKSAGIQIMSVTCRLEQTV